MNSRLHLLRRFHNLPPLLTLLSALALWVIAPGTAAASVESDMVEVGRHIYLDGVLPNGQPLRGVRPDTGPVSGRDAACVACHRRSGLGAVEGNVGVPPITGPALFGGGDVVLVRMDRRFELGLSQPHPPYDAATFAAALRQGRHQTGRVMQGLMPRFELTDAQSEAVASYLKTLSVQVSAGVTPDTLHLATVIAPGVEPQRRKVFLDTMQTLINQFNVTAVSNGRQKVSPVERRLHSRRKWVLQVWDLTGPSSGWAEQLARRQQAQPVFAVLSGLAKDEWQPVQDFCETNHVGCWFPSVDKVPEGAEQSRYSLYYSAGVVTEARVLATRLRAGVGRVIQLVSPDDVSRSAASALRRGLAALGSTTQVVDLELSSNAQVAAIQAALADLGPQDALVSWLRTPDLAKLADLPGLAAPVYASATLGGGEQVPLPTAWRKQATLVQPLEESRLRASNLERFDAWTTAMRIPVLDQRLQSEVYFATRYLSAVVRNMLNNLYTDYLIERAESTLSMFEAMQVQEEIQGMMMSPINKRPVAPLTAEEVVATEARKKNMLAHLDEMRQRGGTTVYPRLSLGPDQRFAAKGAYLVTLNPQGGGTIGEPEWVVP